LGDLVVWQGEDVAQDVVGVLAQGGGGFAQAAGAGEAGLGRWRPVQDLTGQTKSEALHVVL
jgi:hypothetical protein